MTKVFSNFSLINELNLHFRFALRAGQNLKKTKNNKWLQLIIFYLLWKKILPLFLALGLCIVLALWNQFHYFCALQWFSIFFFSLTLFQLGFVMWFLIFQESIKCNPPFFNILFCNLARFLFLFFRLWFFDNEYSYLLVWPQMWHKKELKLYIAIVWLVFSNSILHCDFTLLIKLLLNLVNKLQSKFFA